MMTEFLTDAASIFFAGWTLIIASLSAIAFGPDLFPSKVAIASRRLSQDNLGLASGSRPAPTRNANPT
jgi:hypothetical protein